MIDRITEGGAVETTRGNNDKPTQVVAPTRSELSGDALQNTIAFKGISAGVLADVVRQVQAVGRDQVYPVAAPNWREPQIDWTVSTTPHYSGEGRVSPQEAIALQMGAMEISALFQATHVDSETDAVIKLALRSTLGIDDAYIHDAVTGMADFHNHMRGAASRRDGNKMSAPEFDGAVKKDRGILGPNVAEAAVAQTKRFLDDNLKIDRMDGARTDIRKTSRIAGAEFAKRQYLETLQLAQRLPKPKS